MVDEIIAESYNYVALGMDNMNPIVPYGPRFSIQFQIALSLLEGREGLKKIMVNDAYASKKLQEPLFRSTMNKVKTLYNKEMDKEWSEDCLYSAKVKIKLLNGKLYESYIAYPKGEPENDMTKEELEEKYIMLATKIIPIDTAKLILNKVEQLETLTDINALSNLFIKQ
jgi:2-methylcitrate dehydratase PrpD